MAVENGINIVTRVLVDKLALEEEDIRPDASLRDDLGLDSLDAIELNSGLEEATGILLPPEALRNVDTIAEVAELLDSRGGASAS